MCCYCVANMLGVVGGAVLHRRGRDMLRSPASVRSEAPSGCANLLLMCAYTERETHTHAYIYVYIYIYVFCCCLSTWGVASFEGDHHGSTRLSLQWWSFLPQRQLSVRLSLQATKGTNFFLYLQRFVL